MAVLLRLPDDSEVPCLFVWEQKLVGLEGIIRAPVLIFNELRLVVAKCQQENTGGLQLILPSIDDEVQPLVGAPVARLADMNVDGVFGQVGFAPAHANAENSSRATSAIFFTVPSFLSARHSVVKKVAHCAYQSECGDHRGGSAEWVLADRLAALKSTYVTSVASGAAAICTLYAPER